MRDDEVPPEELLNNQAARRGTGANRLPRLPVSEDPVRRIAQAGPSAV